MILHNGIRIDGRRFFRLPRTAVGAPQPAHLNPNPNEYEASTSAVLSLIARRATGRIVLGLLPPLSRTLTIVPSTNNMNAGASPLVTERAFGRGAPVLTGDNGQAVNGPNGRPLLGVGGGAEVRLLFNHWNLNPRNSAFVSVGTTPDEVLLHEIVHAFRQMSGRLTNQPTGTSFGNEDEFLAVIVADIYASEGGATGLRATHNVRLPRSIRPNNDLRTRGALGSLAVSSQGAMFDMPDLLRGAAPALEETFATQHRAIFDRLRSQESALFTQLATVPAHFNPIRVHLTQVGLLRAPSAPARPAA
jgi:hypothetical protein